MRLFRTAATADHFDDTDDDQEDRPRDIHEAPGEHGHRSQKEVNANEDDEPRYYFVMRAFADHTLSYYLFFFHK
jgi:hypothetical protein